jgi:hypothetical protein
MAIKKPIYRNGREGREGRKGSEEFYVPFLSLRPLRLEFGFPNCQLLLALHNNPD